jgi:D-glycero-alpha-D-manno-heptose-7-phosphate kinase
MISSKCSLRISLAGGSTDLQEFVDSNGYGAVISFPCDLYTYINLFRDKNGYNSFYNKYIVNYTVREEVETAKDVKNDIAREVLSYFNCEPANISFNAYIFSEGSGLASSSAYLIACIKAVSAYKKVALSEFDVCSLALELERKFNPLTGYQDIYGCGVSGFKKINFYKDNKVKVEYLNSSFLNCFDMYLLYTGIKRKSTELLTSLDLGKVGKILPLVDEIERSINNLDVEYFLDIIREGWMRKKETSPMITSNKIISEMDQIISEDESVLAHRLCGAGNGGYFLLFKKRGSPNNLKNCFRIKMAEQAVTCKSI